MDPEVMISINVNKLPGIKQNPTTKTIDTQTASIPLAPGLFRTSIQKVHKSSTDKKHISSLETYFQHLEEEFCSVNEMHVAPRQWTQPQLNGDQVGEKLITPHY